MNTILGLPRAAPAEIGLSAAGLDRVTRFFQREIDAGLLPGAVVAVLRHGKLGYLRCLGKRDPASGVAMSDDTVFRIYSMTKPIVSLAAMMLLEEGRFAIGDLVAKYLPAFAATKVGLVRDGALTLVPQERPMTVQDLLRHTSGIPYGAMGDTPVHRLYREADLDRRDRSNAEVAAAIAALPLLHQPGRVWEYGFSTDLLGHLVELWSGESLGAFLARRIFAPLGMVDTGFHLPADKHARLAQPFANQAIIDVRQPPVLEAAGGGLVSTAADFLRFAQLMLNGGSLDGVRLISPRTVRWMTADHLGGIDNSSFLLAPNLGFGLGVAVQRVLGGGGFPATSGTYFWAGAAGTFFWVDPVEELVALLLVQVLDSGGYLFTRFMATVNSALVD